MTTKWFSGALVLSIALSLAMAGGAWAQPQERGSGSGYGSGYGSDQESGYGSQKAKKQTPPAKSDSEGSMGVCTPQSCPGSKTPKPATGRSSDTETSR